MTEKQKLEIFSAELELIISADIQNFTHSAIMQLPDYFFSVPASSTGKYHPAYALGEGGLLRHTKAAINIAASMFGNTTICGKFSQRDRDCIISALILHDGFKSGLVQQSNTCSNHPTLVVEYLREYFTHNMPNEDEYYAMEEVFPLIESHMGQWNTDKDGKVILPLPASGPARYVHMCDYLASRKLIEINFDQCIS
jgi:hypothetical protein